jgi:phage tail-like protein
MSWTDPGYTLRFAVIVDQVDLGAWSKCEGLSVEQEIHEFKEGGLNEYIHRLPGRIKYSTIKLSRIVNDKSPQVAAWISKSKGAGAYRTGAIAVLDADGAAVVTWNLVDVLPVRWSGPTLDVNGREVATETLEIAHNGFTVS